MTALLIILTIAGLGYLAYIYAALVAIIKFDAIWPLPPSPFHLILGAGLPGLGGWAAVTLALRLSGVE